MAITMMRSEGILRTKLAAIHNKLSLHITTFQTMCPKTERTVFHHWRRRLKESLNLNMCIKFTLELQPIFLNHMCFSLNCYATTTETVSGYDCNHGSLNREQDWSSSNNAMTNSSDCVWSMFATIPILIGATVCHTMTHDNVLQMLYRIPSTSS